MSISEMCTTFIKKDTDSQKILHKNVLEFSTAPWGLGLGTVQGVPPLYPAQRFILKAYYGLEFDKGANRDIIIKDMFNEKERYRFNESEYLKYMYNEGRINIGEQTEDGYPNLELVVGRRGGKCIVGDSLVLTDKGIYPIEDLGEASEEDFSETDIGIAQEKGRFSRASAFYNGGVQDTFEIVTKSGYSIVGTANHRVKVIDETGNVTWRYLDEIKPEDYVAINRSTDLWAQDFVDIKPYKGSIGRIELSLPNVLDACVGNLIGYLVGDKLLTEEHPETSVEAREIFNNLGCQIGIDRDKKEIPWSILQSPKSVVCAFLRGLFEVDGEVDPEGRKITFSSASFRLVHELQVLLLNLGIVSNAKKKWEQKTREHYALLTIKGARSLQRFSDLVGFDSKKKMVPVLDALAKIQEGGPSTESIPHQETALRNLLGSISVRDSGEDIGRSKLRGVLGATLENNKENFTYDRAKRIIQLSREIQEDSKEIKHFEELVLMDYFYDPVVSVLEREDPVYDLTVPDGFSFVANGMTNHNTTLTSCIISFETYKLLSFYSPQEYYGIMPEDDIRVTCVATSKETASELFNKVTGHLERSEFFRKYRSKPTKQSMYMQTQRDLDKYGKGQRSTLSVHVAPCSAKGLVGHSNIVVALDEMALYFYDEKKGSSGIGGSSDRNDRAVYEAVTPSIAKFKGRDGKPHGKVICISSPMTKTGKFYEEYERSFESDCKDLLMINAPTWELDCNLSSGYLKQKYTANPTVFACMFGAEFSDQVRGWIEDPEIVRHNVVPGLRYKERSSERVPHFMGIDVGFKGDGTAICICHYVQELVNGAKEDFIEIDRCDVRFADNEGKKNFTPQDVVDWIEEYTKKFYIVKGLMDQYYAMGIMPLLEEKGLKQFEARMFTETLNSQLYQNLLTQLIAGGIRLPEGQYIVDGKVDKDTELVRELLSLQAFQKSKYVIRVEAPDRKDAHDDRSDAFARSVLIASDYKNKGYGMKITGTAGGKARSYKMMKTMQGRKAELRRPLKGILPSTTGRRSRGFPEFHSSFR